MDYIILSTSAASNAGLLIAPTGFADAVSYMKVYNPSTFKLRPSEKISVLIIPHDDGITPTEASGYLADANQVSDPSRGMYIWRHTNDNETRTLTDLHVFPLDRSFENVKYDLYWLQEHSGSIIFDSETAGVYSYPHNLQPQELKVSAELIDNNTKMRYTLTFPEVNNSGSVDYGAGNYPYLLNISYTYGAGTVTGVFESVDYIFSDSTVYSGFTVGYPTDGITFDLPYYDPRPGWNQVPAQYKFRVGYNCADPLVTGSLPLIIPINHQELSDTQLIDLDSWITTHLDASRLRKVDDVYIERETIDRKRLSIGIKDIAIKQNSYKKKGVYISNPYISEYPIYTFSLKVNEFIPEYSNLEKYDVVKYFIEFNNQPWIQISPINRNLEFDSTGNSVPKMFVFDKNRGQENKNIKFLDYQTSITIFRVKIVIDVSSSSDTMFIPPEIRGYKCIIFDKNQLLEI